MQPNLMAGNISNSNIWKKNDEEAQLQVAAMFEDGNLLLKKELICLLARLFYYAEEAFKALEIMKKTGLQTVVTIAPMALKTLCVMVGQ